MNGEPIRAVPKPVRKVSPARRPTQPAWQQSNAGPLFDTKATARRGAGAVVALSSESGGAALAFPKPVKREKEPKRLRQIGARKQARIDTGEERAGMARSWMKPKPPRRLSHPDYDAGREEFARAQMCPGLALFAGHICVGANEASHERNPMGQLPTGTGRKEPSRLTCGKCSGLHRDWTDATGPFEGWSNEERHVWMLARTDETNAAWAALTEDQRDWWRGEATRRAAERRAARRSLRWAAH